MPAVRLTAEKLNVAHEAVRKVLACPELTDQDAKVLVGALKLLDGLWSELDREPA